VVGRIRERAVRYRSMISAFCPLKFAKRGHVFALPGLPTLEPVASTLVGHSEKRAGPTCASPGSMRPSSAMSATRLAVKGASNTPLR